MAAAPPPLAGAGGPPPPGPAAPGTTSPGLMAGGAPPPAVIQLVALISDAIQRLGQTFPPALPMINQIGDLLDQIQAKVNATQAPTQPQAPPV